MGNPGASAYAVSRVTRALVSADAIEYAVQRWTGPLPQRDLERFTESWRYGRQSRSLLLDVPGKPGQDRSQVVSGGQVTIRTVNYPGRSWSVSVSSAAGSGAPSPPATCGGDIGDLAMGSDQRESAADWKSAIVSGLKCGVFSVAGHREVDGVSAIELVPDRGVKLALWIDARSYLPVQADVDASTTVGAGTGSKPVAIKVETDFRWLPPTPANRAQLTAPVPPGFRRAGG